MPKSEGVDLSYQSREECIADAKNKGVSDAPCQNLPSKGTVSPAKKSPNKGMY